MVNPHFQINVILQGFVWEKIILRPEITLFDELYEQTTRWSYFRIKLQFNPIFNIWVKLLAIEYLLVLQTRSYLCLITILTVLSLSRPRKYFQSSAFNSTILPFSTFGQLWNFCLAFLVRIILACNNTIEILTTTMDLNVVSSS